jgi:hypothetical protein
MGAVVGQSADDAKARDYGAHTAPTSLRAGAEQLIAPGLERHGDTGAFSMIRSTAYTAEA